MPRAPKKCGNHDCEERVRARKYCDVHSKSWQGSARSGANTTQADKQLRAQVLAEEPSCRDCGAPSTVAGHIRPHAYGGVYVRDNLKGQCEPCNLAQIQTDRQARGGGGV
jgi:5-methylcytosine-specific restriction endonuclease McrA